MSLIDIFADSDWASDKTDCNGVIMRSNNDWRTLHPMPNCHTICAGSVFR